MFTIRRFEEADVASLIHTCWSYRPSEEITDLTMRVARLRRQNRGDAAVVLVQGVAVGFGMLTVWVNRGEISDLIVQEELRRQGLGTRMIDWLCLCACEYGATSMEIGVISDNKGALRLYERLDFVPYRTLRLNISSTPGLIIYLHKTLQCG